MTIWIIDPRDPVIFGDGKPFSAIPGTSARSLPFPYPSTVAGAVRSHSGRDRNGRFDATQIATLKQTGIRGPLLVALDCTGSTGDWLLPAPGDCLVLRAGEEQYGKRLWLRPLSTPADCATNLADGLHPIGAKWIVKEKPHPHPSRFWTWDAYQRWLIDPGDDPAAVDLEKIGLPGPARESRTHVSIVPSQQTAREGFLFQTSGLEFLHTQRNGDGSAPPLYTATKLALAVDTEASLRADWGFVGGERRVARWRKGSASFPTCPPGIEKSIKDNRSCRLILATPAIFDKGYLPTWLRQIAPNLSIEIVAAAAPRYQTVSGWDYEHRNPKPTRRLAPAGSVYFLKLTGDDASIARFITTVWMQNISDRPQDRLDGFGLAVLGAWDGLLTKLEVKDAA